MTCQETVLIIDGEDSVGRFVKDTLETEGKQVLLAFTAREGLEYLQSQRVDIVFTELKLPDGNGISVIQTALQVHPNIASVVITGFGTLESAIEAMRLGACDFITKPFSRPQILKALHRAINLTKLNTFPKWENASTPPSREKINKTFVAHSSPMREVIAQAKKFSQMDIPVLIQGESGVGKKSLARMIHRESPFSDGPFIHINCSIIESTVRFNKQGVGILDRLLQADSVENEQKTTLFLEDIDQLPKLEQRQLLKMLKEGLVRAPWAPVSKVNSIRLITSTSVDLKAAVLLDEFHRSLYDNLNILPIQVPPLRERKEDIIPLAMQILEELCQAWSCNFAECRSRMSTEICEKLYEYSWPGNVQELTSVLSRLLLTGDSVVVTKLLNQSQSSNEQEETISVPFLGDLKQMERHMVSEVVKRCGGNKAAAARTLGMHRRTLYRILSNESEDEESGQSVGIKH
ncbi:sigma-54-dependent transcriptional regulator [Gimesia sp.]|uniref:sigma-54-dependent transcriptional regulator n=1 Tax=Gimesia sp. TaxID=2024833 RepID=UPI003A8D7C6C